MGATLSLDQVLQLLGKGSRVKSLKDHGPVGLEGGFLNPGEGTCSDGLAGSTFQHHLIHLLLQRSKQFQGRLGALLVTKGRAAEAGTPVPHDSLCACPQTLMGQSLL